ncbi:hypothetical protein [Alteromonas macleodii]|uniref:hypothetical protein n=2 Tax=Alteromonas macleodii TaxID=28108 RepID=UPI0031403562|tara:strand:+ start:106725 stop:107159 length:435 start_codon:yes stop_codon:yes gene_type:complete
MYKILSVILAAVIMTGCSVRADFVPNAAFDQETEITAVGLGVLPDDEDMPIEQRHMLAVKASEYDAYRVLASKIYGVNVSSKVTIQSLATENDSFKAQVEGLIQMAEKVETTPVMNGYAYETTMKVRMTPEFRNYVLTEVENRN